MARQVVKAFGLPLGGMDQRVPSGIGSDPRGPAWLIQNMHRERLDGAWSSLIGFERYLRATTNHAAYTTGPTSRIRSVFVWQPHRGALSYPLFESGSKLMYVSANPATLNTVASGLTLPATNELAGDYAVYGDRLIYVNGHDTPLVLWVESGELRSRTLGWWNYPSPPSPWGYDASTTGALPNTTNVSCGMVDDPDIGLGSVATGVSQVTSRYAWMVAFVNLDGSISPPSPMSAQAEWLDPLLPATWLHKKPAIYLEGIPTGPTGTVARYVYQTANLGASDDPSGASETDFYVLDRIPNNVDTTYWAATPDSSLGARVLDETVLCPCRRPYLVGVFGGCVWLVDADTPTRVHRTRAGTVDDFDVDGYFDVRSDVVRLYPHYDLLLVFRKTGIDAIRITESGDFAVDTIAEGVGCTAGHSVAGVPGFGVLFANDDGAYALSGGYRGGSTVQIRKVSDPIQDQWRRVARELLPSASGCYSPLWGEYHLYVPIDGNQTSICGFVLSDSGEWSVRTDHPVGAVTTDLDGEIVFGHATGSAAGTATVPQGLYVISRRRVLGDAPPPSGQVVIDGAPPTAVYRSGWIDLPDPIHRAIPLRLTIFLLTGTRTGITVQYRKDWQPTTTFRSSVSQAWVRPEGETWKQATYGTATWGTDSWTESIPTELTYDISLDSCARFQFQVSTTADIRIAGYVAWLSAPDTTIDQMRR